MVSYENEDNSTDRFDSYLPDEIIKAANENVPVHNRQGIGKEGVVHCLGSGTTPTDVRVIYNSSQLSDPKVTIPDILGSCQKNCRVIFKWDYATQKWVK